MRTVPSDHDLGVPRHPPPGEAVDVSRGVADAAPAVEDVVAGGDGKLAGEVLLVPEARERESKGAT